MNYRKVLVTGGSGGLGWHVVAKLGAHHEPTVLDLNPPAQDVPYVRGDVLDIGVVRKALRGQEALVHLAAIDLGVPAEPEQYFGVNVMGTWNVLQAAHEAGIDKAVLVSSVAASGLSELRPDFVPEYLPFDETHPAKPVHPYAVSKRVMEEVAQSFARRGNMTVVCLRPVVIAFAAHVPTMIERSRNPAHRWLAAYVSPEDTAEAVSRTLDYTDTRFEVLYLAAEDSCSPEPTLERARRLFGRLPEVRDRALFERRPRASMVDAARARRRLGWHPTSSWDAITSAAD